MDGCTATTTIREYLYDLEIEQPIICGVTGHTEEEYINKCIKYGMNKVYSKPLNYILIKELLISLNFIWRMRKNMDEYALRNYFFK